MKIAADNIILRPDQNESILPQIVMKTYSLPSLPEITVIRKSLDARKKNDIHYRCRISFDVESHIAETLLALPEISLVKQPEPYSPPKLTSEKHVVVIGSGPAGLFAALRLILAGIRVTMLERGKAVEERMEDIERLEAEGILNPESNAVYGEGGAGTYSDGKLTARTRKPESAWLFDMLHEHGADASVLAMAKPHIGTDRLRLIIQNVRKTLISRGADIRFSCRVDSLIIKDNRCIGVKAGDEEIAADAVILATGNSARDVYRFLSKQNIGMEAKGTAVGVRIEHPAELIREIQYGNSKYKHMLPAAEYVLTAKNPKTGRGTYSFCMCPGGFIINSSCSTDHLCVNGMSNSKRNSAFSNSAVVVSVDGSDYGDGPLSGPSFQEKIEKAAFLAGGSSFRAPAQRLTSFLKKKTDAALPKNSYRPDVTAAEIDSYLPESICREMREAFRVFDRKMRGFITDEAVLIGAETRTSSAVRILRDRTLQSVNTERLFPAGEGAGYSGGIVSSAVDGIRTADSVISILGQV